MIASEPDSAEDWNNQGVTRFSQGDVTGALVDFDQALKLQPDYPEALNNRGIVRHRLGDRAGALADFDRALELRPRYLEALTNRAVTRIAVGDLAGALTDFDRAIGINPNWADAYHGRAAALHASGEFDAALADYGRVLGRIPPEASAPVHHLRAAVLVKMKRFTEAVAECTRALDLEPGFCMAYISRGNARYHLRDPGGLNDYRTAFRLDHVGAATEVIRLLATDAANDPAEVLENCRQHIRISPDDVVAYGRRGLTLILLGREAEAGPDLEAFLSRAPDWSAALQLMIRLARNRLGG